MSANRAWVSCWYLGVDQNNTGRGKVVKCSRHTNNTYFVVSTARGLKKSERCCCSSCGFFLFSEECLSRFVLTKATIWMDVSDWWAVPWQYTHRRSVNIESAKRKRMRGQKSSAGNGKWNEKERGRVTKPCASKWEMKTQRGSVGVWGPEQEGLTKAIIIYSGMS